MKRFIEGEDRHQVTLLPECLGDYCHATRWRLTQLLISVSRNHPKSASKTI